MIMQTELTLTPRARASDPQTSHAAAASVTELTEKQQAVLAVIQEYGPMTHEYLVYRYHGWTRLPFQTDSGIRTRCKELVRLGQVVDTGERREISTGRKTIVWRAA